MNILSYSPRIIHPGRPIRCMSDFLVLSSMSPNLSFLLFIILYRIWDNNLSTEYLYFNGFFSLLYCSMQLFSKSSFSLIIFCSILIAFSHLFSFFSMLTFSQVLKIRILYAVSSPEWFFTSFVILDSEFIFSGPMDPELWNNVYEKSYICFHKVSERDYILH